MNKKELKKLAMRIAKLELIVQNTADHEEKNKAQNEIMNLTGHVDDVDELFCLDELIQDYLKQQEN